MSAKTSFTFYYCIFNLYIKKLKCSLVKNYLLYFVCVRHMCVHLWAPGSQRSNSGVVPQVPIYLFFETGCLTCSRNPWLAWSTGQPAPESTCLCLTRAREQTCATRPGFLFLFVPLFVFMLIWRNELVTSLTKPSPQARESYFRIMVSTFPYSHANVRGSLWRQNLNSLHSCLGLPSVEIMCMHTTAGSG